MTTYWLKINLESDAAFGRGDGVPGVVDAEVQHDEYGLPFMSGKTLKGLLTASCAEILDSLILAGNQMGWQAPASRLFGSPGHKTDDMGNLHVSDARLPEYVRAQIMADQTLSRQKVLESLTSIRTHTAIDPETGAPKDHSLRSMRVILRI
ncbi:MAG: RAMP superfamily CRISPR-associated protein, partial [Chloroflexota bacterium]